MRSMHSTIVAAMLLTFSSLVHADITIGVVQPLTGPASGLGIPIRNAVTLWPSTLAGENLKVIILDDSSDPTTGVKATQRLITEDKADIILGSTATPVAISMAAVAAASGTPQLATAPAALPEGKDTWTFRLAQSNAVMAQAMVAHMQKKGVKTVGFLGYTDAYGELWLKSFTEEADKADIKLVATERFVRNDTSVTAQALKIAVAKPDAVLIVASGSGAGMPQKAVRERGYQGYIYQTHAAVTRDLMRTARQDAEGTYLVSGPGPLAEQLPDSNPSKPLSIAYVQAYEKAYGPETSTQVAAHSFDAYTLLEKAVPVALKKAEAGTPEFRAALRDALENMGPTPISQGVLTWTPTDHWGYTRDAGVMLQVVGGKFKVDQ